MYYPASDLQLVSPVVSQERTRQGTVSPEFRYHRIGRTTMAVPHTKTSGGARLAVVYLTVGSIIDVWSALWFFWMRTHGDGSDSNYFWCYGFFLTGLTLVIIGLALGKIGRSAREAEAPVDNTANAPVPPQPTTVPAAPMPIAPQAAIPNGNVQGLSPAAPGGAVAPVAAPRR